MAKSGIGSAEVQIAMKLPIALTVFALAATSLAQTRANVVSPPKSPGKAAVSSPAPGRFAGTWLLNGTDRSTRFVFNKNGTFAYAGWGATSKGNWRYDGQAVYLVWTEIDKQKVAAGKVKKSFQVNDSGELIIDKYKYRRAG